jgi:hypothetical protein
MDNKYPSWDDVIDAAERVIETIIDRATWSDMDEMLSNYDEQFNEGSEE